MNFEFGCHNRWWSDFDRCHSIVGQTRQGDQIVSIAAHCAIVSPVILCFIYDSVRVSRVHHVPRTRVFQSFNIVKESCMIIIAAVSIVR